MAALRHMHEGHVIAHEALGIYSDHRFSERSFKLRVEAET